MLRGDVFNLWPDLRIVQYIFTFIFIFLLDLISIKEHAVTGRVILNVRLRLDHGRIIYIGLINSAIQNFRSFLLVAFIFIGRPTPE